MLGEMKPLFMICVSKTIKTMYYESSPPTLIAF
jgi:hypothetical protein